MKSSIIALALAGSALANPKPQGVSASIAPQASTPSGCSDSMSGTFSVTVVNVTSSKRDVEKRQAAGILTLSLNGGKLKDQAGRTGYVAANYQFQFDSPPQTGAIYTSGFSLCGNNSLALGGSAIWYQCYSGGFYNLYDRHWAAQCNPIYLVASTGDSGPVSQSPDGQPGATSAASQRSDGQPIAPTAPVSQMSDGQPQATTAAVISQLTDGQPQAPTGAPQVSVISDGQPQAPTAGAPVSQLTDGQPQAPTGMPVSQISDGQPQAPSGAPVSQISDGQPQAPTATGPLVSQITDGQPQAPTPVGPKVSQISDGQPQATGNGTLTLPSSPAQFTGAATTPVYNFGAFAAGLLGLVALL